MKLRTTLVLSALAAAVPSFAVIATTSTTNYTPEDFNWLYVGKMSGASAVAVGPHAVLTAKHLSGGDFTLGGTTYHMVSNVVGPMVNGFQSDLRLVTVSETLPGWYDLGSAPAAGSAVTMVGYGLTGKLDASGDHYSSIGNGGTRRAGGNTLDGTFVTNLGPAHIAYLHTPGDAALAAGDSGGGWFDSNGHLIGINSFIFNDTDWAGGSPTPPDQLVDYGFSNANVNGWNWSGTYQGQHYDVNIAAGESFFGSGAIDVTDPTIRQWAIQNGAVPEPASMAVLGLGALALLRKRKG